jgi:hypothetical protein
MADRRKQRRNTTDSAADLLIDAGATRELAHEIVSVLSSAGLPASRIRTWLAHPERGASIQTGTVMIDGEHLPRRQTAIFAVEDGHADLVLAEARRFASATQDERAIALCLGQEMARIDALTGSDARRAATIVHVLDVLKKRLGKDVHVADLVQTEIPAWDRARIVDRFITGREQEVLDALTAGRIDVDQLHKDGMVVLGW